ncbi:hypothetical protein BJX96DRAFT_149430 [Aspergillus floccosus]
MHGLLLVCGRSVFQLVRAESSPLEGGLKSCSDVSSRFIQNKRREYQDKQRTYPVYTRCIQRVPVVSIDSPIPPSPSRPNNGIRHESTIHPVHRRRSPNRAIPRNSILFSAEVNPGKILRSVAIHGSPSHQPTCHFFFARGGANRCCLLFLDHYRFFTPDDLPSTVVSTDVPFTYSPQAGFPRPRRLRLPLFVYHCRFEKDITSHSTDTNTNLNPNISYAQ